MKPVPRLPEQPEALQKYLAEIKADPTAKCFHDEHASGDESAGAWSRFNGHAAYKAVREELVARQRGLCAYCELRLTHATGLPIDGEQQIEHVLPKSSPSPGRVLNWENFILCCAGGSVREDDAKYKKRERHYDGRKNTSCGQWKGNTEPDPACDPRDFQWSSRLVFVDDDGTISADAAGCAAAMVDPEKLDRTINKLLNLNCKRLKRERSERLVEIGADVVWHHELALAKAGISDARKREAEEFMAGLLLGPDEHGYLRDFWTSYRQFLGDWAERWIAKNWEHLAAPAPPRPAPLPAELPRFDGDTTS